MTRVTNYFRDLFESVTAVIEGMSITLSYVIRRPTTIQYPDRIARTVQSTLPLRYRGHLEVDMDICTACLACERECPIACIAIEVGTNKETKQRAMTQFDIDLCKCMYCGICSEVCPTGAIRHSQEFEGTCNNPAGLVRHFVYADAPAPPYKPKKGGETEEKLIRKVEVGKKYMAEFAEPD